MEKRQIELFLMINEPAFTIGDIQYSVCCPEDQLFCTWDSEENTFDFSSLDDLLDHWIVDGKPFREVIDSVMANKFDVVRLRDGRIGKISDVLNEETFILDVVDETGRTPERPTVLFFDIEKVLYSNVRY